MLRGRPVSCALVMCVTDFTPRPQHQALTDAAAACARDLLDPQITDRSAHVSMYSFNPSEAWTSRKVSAECGKENIYFERRIRRKGSRRINTNNSFGTISHARPNEETPRWLKRTRRLFYFRPEKALNQPLVTFAVNPHSTAFHNE